MISGRRFLKKIIDEYGRESVKRSYRFPIAYLSVESSRFATMDDEKRELEFASSLGITINDLRNLENRLFFNVQLFVPGECDALPVERGESWLKLLMEDGSDQSDVEPLEHGPKTLHFYGHKGGQARSTVLSFLARALADMRWRVLTVDVDAEAPSLDLIFRDTPPDLGATLVGVRAGHRLRPYRVYTGLEDGYVDLVAFRGVNDDVDLDAAALAMELALSPPSNDLLVSAVRAEGKIYDVIFVDHRSGLGATIPPWVRGLPGPIIAFARMDDQWRRARSHLTALWSLRPSNPGVLVSFKPDEELETRFVVRHIDQARSALECLAEAMSLAIPAGNEAVSVDDVMDHWIVWPYDPAFREEGPASASSVGAGVRQALHEMQRLLGLAGLPLSKRDGASVVSPLHPSGAQDEGEFIVTHALRELTAPSSPYWFVSGRKGTGKTRLVRELAKLDCGSPLLVADDFPESLGGVNVRNKSVKFLIDEKVDRETFWWSLIASANKVGIHRQALETELASWPGRLVAGETPFASLLNDLGGSTSDRPPQVFLIDGLETAFTRKDTYEFVEALFRVWSTIESNYQLQSRIALRIFIRTDLANRGYENFEQLTHSRMLELRWNTQYILNFALSRILAHSWFQTNFPKVIEELEGYRREIRQGALSVETCEQFLLKVFPQRLRRQNMLTTTFLRTWFSDDPKAEQGFYPRIYDLFLSTIADPPVSSDFSDARIEDGVISQDLIFYAHERATIDFLQQVRVELKNLVDLNDEEIIRVLDAFRGKQTPFDVQKMEHDLYRNTNIEPFLVRQTLEQMKALGVFEGRPGYAGQWRAGRLFKTSLGMLYNRKRSEKKSKSVPFE
jgi:hypothetical protein